MAEAIHNFTTRHIAFYRPVKKVYFLLSWDEASRKWCNFHGILENITLNRSTRSRNGSVTINIASSVNKPSQSINISADGYFLKSNNVIIPVVKKFIGSGMNVKYVGREYTILDTPLTQGPEVLWSVVAPSPPSPSPPHVASPYVATPEPKAIPQRIAWLVAEDACKRGEVCSITTGEISPITAAVSSCYHVFDYDSIFTWLQTNTTCPVCREKCVITRAFE